MNGDTHKTGLNNGYTADNHPGTSAGIFFQALQLLASSEGCKEVQMSIAKIIDLERQVEALKKEKESLDRNHREHRRNLHETHCDALERAQKGKADLESRFTVVNDALLKEKKARKEEEIAKVKANASVEQATKDLRTQEDLYLKLENKTRQLDNAAEAANEQVDKLQNEIKEKDAQALTLMKSLDEISAENNSLDTKLESTIQELQVWEGYTKNLHSDSLGTFVEEFEKLWKSAYGAILSYFKEDLGSSITRDSKRWREFRKSAKLTTYLPIPQSDSNAAKCMRAVAVLSVLARSLHEHVFTPTYVLAGNRELREVLLREAEIDSKRESLFRGLLITIFEKQQPRNGEENRIQHVLNDVREVVENLLDASAIGEFDSKLRQVVETAQKLWSRMQRNKQFFESTVELDPFPDRSEWQWRPIKLLAKPSFSSQTGPDENLAISDESLLVVFPAVYYVKENECDGVVFPGYALPRSQIIAAAAEVEKVKVSNGISERTHLKMSSPSTTAAAESVTSGEERSQGTLKKNFLG